MPGLLNSVSRDGVVKVIANSPTNSPSYGTTTFVKSDTPRVTSVYPPMVAKFIESYRELDNYRSGATF